MKLSETNMPSKMEMEAWITGFTKWPHRCTGTKEGRESASYVADVFKQLGLDNVTVEPVSSICRRIKECNFSIEGKAVTVSLANGTNRHKKTGTFITDTGKTEIIYLGRGNKEDFEDVDVKGKIVVCDVFFKPHKRKSFMDSLEGACAFDPDGDLDEELNIFDIYSPNDWPFNYMMASEKGAAGFVGILQNFMDCHYFHEDYSDIVAMDEYMEMAAVWVSKQDGEWIEEIISERGTVFGEMKVTTVYEYGDALNVFGELQGQSEDMFVIHSHHDAVSKGAVQDASGMSVVFALAKFFSSIPMEERKTNLVFLSTDSHYTDYEGHVGFIRNRKEEGRKIAFDFSIEHIAKEMELDSKNNMLIYDRPETRLLYVSKINGMPDIAYETIKKNNLKKTMVLPVTRRPKNNYQSGDVCTDAYDFYAAGIPVVSLISAPMYLFHDSDDINKVDFNSLEPVANVMMELVRGAWKTFGYY